MLRKLLQVLLLCALVAGMASAQTLTIAQGVDATTLDPNDQEETPTQNIVNNIFDPLLKRGTDGSVLPWLATSVEAVSDTVWEITLRDDVFFHNGEHLDAEVVAWNFERAIDADDPIRFISNFQPVSEIRVTGEYSLEVITRTPYPVFITHLTRFFMVSRENYENLGRASAAENPVGTGPYRFVRWLRDQELVLEAFEDYWFGTPSIPSVVFRPIPETSSRVAELITGGVDIITNVSPEAQDLITLSGAADIRTVPSIRNIFIIFTATEEGPLADPRVREALNLAVDVEEIIEGIFQGNAVATATPLNAYIFGYAEELDVRIHDQERARELLAEAGFPDGFSFSLGSPDGRYLNDRLVTEAVAGQLRRIGVDADVRVQEWSSYVGQVLERQVPTDAYLIGWGNSNFDADRSLFTLFYGGTVEGGAGRSVFSYWTNEEFDQLVLEAQSTTDVDARLQLYVEAQELIAAEFPWLFLYQQGDAYGVSLRVEWEARPDELIWAFDASLN